MERMQIGRWTLEYDPALTREAYKYCAGDPERCGCAYCRNWVEARRLVYPPEALALFQQLGIDPSCEVELYEIYRKPSGLHEYGGWFHFVGRIVEERMTHQRAYHSLSEDFSVLFRSEVALAMVPFKGLPLVQLDFRAEAVPWLIDRLEDE